MSRARRVFHAVVLSTLALAAFPAWSNADGGPAAATVPAGTLKPVVQELKQLIDQDPVVRMYFTQMIDQVPAYYQNHPEPNVFVTSVDQMLLLISAAIDKAPVYDETDMVGFPINAILNWGMGVPGGFAVFRNEKVNAIFRKILDEYGAFLSSPASLATLNNGPDGWMSAAAQAKLNMAQYQYDPGAAHWGYASWNDFFTRKLKPGMRPIASPEDDKIIVSACDSNVFRIQRNVKKSEWFWMKSQPYSLRDMLDGDEAAADQFVGGDVYQAFLSATKYHRWHSPVSGTIRKAVIKQGTYYSAADALGLDPVSPNDSQGYLSHVATRAIVTIEADDPQIGLMVFMPIGMAEVSSCVLLDAIKPGYKIKKGEELGYFQYGGSTHCLIFRPGVIKDFTVEQGADVRVGEAIAGAR